MPSGLWLFTQHSPLFRQGGFAPRRHTFMITKEDGTRLYGLALLFPEEVTNPTIKNTVMSLQDLFLANSSSSVKASMELVEDKATIYNMDDDVLFSMKVCGF